MSKLHQLVTNIINFCGKTTREVPEEDIDDIKVLICGYSLDCELDTIVRLERDEYYLVKK